MRIFKDLREVSPAIFENQHFSSCTRFYQLFRKLCREGKSYKSNSSHNKIKFKIRKASRCTRKKDYSENRNKTIARELLQEEQ